VCIAFYELETLGELVPAAPRQDPPLFGRLVQHFAWSSGATKYPQVAAAYRPTPRLLAQAEEAWTGAGTVWPNVDELLRQAVQAHRAGLAVAAAVTARVAVEDAIERSLEALDPSAAWEPLRAAKREVELFDTKLTTPTGFGPMDRSATRAALSLARDFGNQAAHEGHVSDALLQVTIILSLPRALASLSAAVTHVIQEA